MLHVYNLKKTSAISQIWVSRKCSVFTAFVKKYNIYEYNLSKLFARNTKSNISAEIITAHQSQTLIQEH